MKRTTRARMAVAGSLAVVAVGSGAAPAFAAPTSAPDDYVFPPTCSGSYPSCTTFADSGDYVRYAGTETVLGEYAFINQEPTVRYGFYDDNGNEIRNGDVTITDVSQPSFWGSTYGSGQPQDGQFLDEADYDGYLGEASLQSYTRLDGKVDNQIVFKAPASLDPKASRLSVRVLYTAHNSATGENQVGSAVVKVIPVGSAGSLRTVEANDDCYNAGIGESIDMLPLDNDGAYDQVITTIPPGPEITASGGPVAAARLAPSDCATPPVLSPGSSNADLLIGSLATADYSTYDGSSVRTENGTVTLQADKKTVTFTPDPGYAGGDQSFAYLVEDTTAPGGSPLYGAVVTIRVGAAGPDAQGTPSWSRRLDRHW